MGIGFMTDHDKFQGTLWIFRNHATNPTIKEVEFDSQDAIYHLYRHTHNPFLKRAIAPSPKKLFRDEKDLAALFRFFEHLPHYQVAPTNLDDPHQLRQVHHPPPPPVLKPHFVQPPDLPGNLYRLPWMVDVFFQAILARLRRSPKEFREVVEELMARFQEDRVRIKLYESYRLLKNWWDFMETLEEISRYPSPETFDLFCSALFVYYQLVYPPQVKEPAPKEGAEKPGHPSGGPATGEFSKKA